MNVFIGVDQFSLFFPSGFVGNGLFPIGVAPQLKTLV